MENPLCGRRRPQRRSHGLHRQRAGRKQARRYRHFAARHRRAAGRTGVCRRKESGDAARRNGRGRFQEDGHRLHRAALRARSGRAHRGGVTRLKSWMFGTSAVVTRSHARAWRGQAMSLLNVIDAQIALAAMFTVSANNATLKMNEMMPWTEAVWRIGRQVIATSDTWLVIPITNEK